MVAVGDPVELGIPETLTGQVAALLARSPGAWAIFTLPCHEEQYRYPQFAADFGAL